MGQGNQCTASHLLKWEKVSNHTSQGGPGIGRAQERNIGNLGNGSGDILEKMMGWAKVIGSEYGVTEYGWDVNLDT